MKMNLSGFKKFFKSKTLCIGFVAILILAPVLIITVHNNGGLSVFNKIGFPTTKKQEITPEGSIGTLSSPANKTNTTDKQTAQPAETDTSSPTTKISNTPGSCTTIKTIPHQTERIDDISLYVGENVVTQEGEDGQEYICTEHVLGHTPGVVYTIQPITERVYVGTRPILESTPEPTPTQPTYFQAEDYCRNRGIPGNTSAWEQCISIYLSSPALW